LPVSEPRVLTRSLGGSPLARAIQDGRIAFVRPAPATPQGWHEHATAVARDFRGRTWAGALWGALSPSGAAASRLERVVASGGVVVTTGQQPGLFGGPIYTWSKALSALAMADTIETQLGVPTAPVFWAATDDADLREAGITYVAVRERVEELSLPSLASASRMLRDVPLGDVTPLLERLEASTGSAPHAASLRAVREAYAPTATVGGAYLALLRRVLEPLGIAVLDAAHPSARAAARPTLTQALARAREIDAALRAREQELRAAGFTAQVTLVDGLSLVFDTVDGERRRVPLAESETLGDQSDADLGPNVLLRPIVERAILPTIAYMAGPGELSYFAQVGAVARALGVAEPLALPRWSGMIIEPHIERILERRGLTPDDLADPHAAETHLATELVPAELRTALDAARVAVQRAVSRIGEELQRTEGPLVDPRVVGGADFQLSHRLDRLERRIRAALKRRNDDQLRELATARASLYPLGKPQERVLNLIPFHARHGDLLIERMRARAVEHAQSLLGAPATVAAGEQRPL
jgi:bacillithiol biosynthesis cysteine-adding enzyme BshC